MYNSLMDLSHCRLAIAKALRSLEAALADLVNALAHRPVAVTMDEDSEESPVRRVCDAYARIDYQVNDEAGKASVVCIGVIGVSRDIARQAQAINLLKAELKALCAPLYRTMVRVPVKGDAGPTESIPASRAILRSIQRSDLNQFAAYRKIPLLATPPATITFTRALTRSVYRKSVEELFTQLNTAEGDGASADRARLHTLSPKESHLAVVKDHYQNVRANVRYHHLDARGRGRVQIAAELPLMYVQGTNDAPTIKFPHPRSAKDSVQRDRQFIIEAEPFLQTLPAYRYLSS